MSFGKTGNVSTVTGRVNTFKRLSRCHLHTYFFLKIRLIFF
jgi:hypothetical protein